MVEACVCCVDRGGRGGRGGVGLLWGDWLGIGIKGAARGALLWEGMLCVQRVLVLLREWNVGCVWSGWTGLLIILLERIRVKGVREEERFVDGCTGQEERVYHGLFCLCRVEGIKRDKRQRELRTCF